MNENFELIAATIGSGYARRAQQEAGRRAAQLTSLMAQRRLPERGWSDEQIEQLLHELSAMDSNNYAGHVGVGEREGRVASALVRRRHWAFAHGVGRSGELAAVQPKAAGSSLFAKLCEWMALHALRLAGLTEVRACAVLPTATGMSLVLAFLALRSARPAAARKVIWPRIDQKTCFKAMLTAGLEPLVVANRLEGDQLCTDLAAIEALIAAHGAESIFGVVSTTSCFAPRGSEAVEGVARLCKQHGLVHVVNNAYGVQARATCAEISRAMRVGRVDVVVSSTDKNFLVPVGGALAYAGDAGVIERLSSAYPGRASSAPCLDLFITLLSLGEQGWSALLAERERLFVYAREQLAAAVAPLGERVLATPRNRVSIGVTLSQVPAARVTQFGAQLFARNCSGARAVDCAEAKQIDGVQFRAWGASADVYVSPYFTVAVAIGSTQEDIDLFCAKLAKLLHDEQRKQRRDNTRDAAAAPRDGDSCDAL